MFLLLEQISAKQSVYIQLKHITSTLSLVPDIIVIHSTGRLAPYSVFPY